jgi:hypothetical protein
LNRVLMALVFWSSFVGSIGFSASIRVEKDGSGNFSIIQDAVNAAADGDTILIGPGVYQDYERVLLGVNWYQIIAFWDDGRSLTFIGAGKDETILGPDVYETGPGVEYFIGIKNYHQESGVIVRDLGFRNLEWGVDHFGPTFSLVNGAQFVGGFCGVVVHGGDFDVVGCVFSEVDDALGSFNAGTIRMLGCLSENSLTYFGSTDNGVVADCTMNSRTCVHYYQSNGLVERSVLSGAELGSAIYLSPGSSVSVIGNEISGGDQNVYLLGPNTSIQMTGNVLREPLSHNIHLNFGASLFATGNDIYARQGYNFVECENYPEGNTAIVDMGGNHWGQYSDPVQLGYRIVDSDNDPSLFVTVNFEPIMTTPLPTEKQSLGGFRAMFR